MSLLSTLKRLFGPAPKPLHAKQLSIQADMIRLLMQRGSITARDILNRTNDAGKMLTRMRRLGVLYEAADPKGFDWKPNAFGTGQHKLYFWTGCMPAGFFPDEERRTRKRGGRC